jgi:1,4-alpha-glucan branching enzyme
MYLNIPATRGYKDLPALHYYDFEWRGFEWIDCNDADNSVLSFIRRSDEEFVMVVVNLTPQPHHGYRIGAPQAGKYREIFNSDSEYYGGSNMGNGGGALVADELPWMNQPYSLGLTLPPLAAVILQLEHDV